MSGGGNAGRRRGRARELDVADFYRQHGWVVYRLAHGCADVVALKAGTLPLLVQVKSTRRPFERFGPADRDALLHEAIMSGGVAVLAHWPLRGRLRLIPSSDWPSSGGELAA